MNGYPIYRHLLWTLIWAGIVLLAVILAWQFLAGVATVVLLLLLGVLLSVILSWPVETLHRHKVPRSVSSPLVVLGVLGLLTLAGYLFLSQLGQQGAELVSELPGAINHFLNRIERLVSNFGLSLDFGGGGGFSLRSFARQSVGGILGVFGNVIFGVAGVIAAIFLAVYLAANPHPVVGWLVRLLPPDRRDPAWRLLSESRSALLSWLSGRLSSMAIIAVLSTIALYIIGIPAPILLGLFAGLASFVPYVGPVISVVPPALLGLAANPIEAVWVILAYIIIQQIETNILTPLIMREAASVHPAVAIAAATLMGAIFGLLGVMLAIPLTVVAGVLIEELWFRHLEEQD